MFLNTAEDQKSELDTMQSAEPSKRSAKLFVVALLVAIAGMAVSVELTLVHHRARQNVSSGCDISQQVSCSSIALTPEAVFLGVPIAVWGLCTYLVFGALAVWGLVRREEKSWPWGLVFWLAGASVIYSVWLAYVAYGKYGFVCLWCTALYAVNMALLVCGAIGLKRSQTGIWAGLVSDLKVVARRYRLTAPLAVAAVVVAGLLIAYYPEPSVEAATAEVDFTDRIKVGAGAKPGETRPGRAGPQEDDRDGAGGGTNQSGEVPKSLADIEEMKIGKWRLIEERTPWVGAEQPDLVVVEFSDYECPFCKTAHLNVHKALEKYKGRMRLYHRHLPLDQSCNRFLKKPYHAHACTAAKAAICARQQGKFWKMNHLLFLNKGSHHGEALEKLAKRAGVDLARFFECMKAEETVAEVKRDIEAAFALKPKGTPTFVFVGPNLKRTVVSGLVEVELFDKLFQALDEAKKKGGGSARAPRPGEPTAPAREESTTR
jgi:protein-disulfide isomerase/uncharacterized membrane protein